jgi:hypothetical protein
MDPRNETHVTGSSSAWFIFNLNTKYHYAQIIHYKAHTWDMVHVNQAPFFLLPALLYLLSLFYLLGEPAFLHMV